MSICSDHSMINYHDLSFLGRFRAVLHTWRDRQRQRQELARFTERDLHDVGISWTEVVCEIEKPFWRA